MQPTSMMRPLASLWLLTVLLLEWTCTQSVAETSNFCARPANMDICWWNNVQKRFLRFGRGDPLIRFGKRAMDPLIRLGRGDPIIRFGRGDPLLRFGRGEPLIRFGRSFEPLIRIGRGDPIIRFGRGEPLIRFGKRGDPETDAMMKELYENNGYLRFGRNADPYLEEDMSDDDDVDASRKRRDAEQNDETAEKTRTKRETSRNENAGFMRWGRGGSDELSAAAAEPAKTIAPGEGGYLRFGRGQNGFQRFGKRYLRFGREGEGGYLRFGKRSAESES